ncbi:MAG: hypothetical protein NC041_01250 [Bacteroides sp.]|nr:hypothetical protein [Prevotella sp.]MCM1408102.1 hypothetical protein [Treponema brennaborense]MCM1469078.1 hypothetical protein [Bacteroides sp.]
MDMKKKKNNRSWRTPPLFSYRKGNSVVHAMPACIKLLLLFVISVRTFSDAPSPLCVPQRTACCGFCAGLLFLLSGTPFSHLKKLLFVPLTGLFVTLFKMISFSETPPYFFADLSQIQPGILYTIRFFITAAAALAVFETTTTLQIQRTLESVQNGISRVIPPLKKPIAAYNPARMFSLAIIFIPRVFCAWNQVNSAARARYPKKNSANKYHISPACYIENICAQFFGMFSVLLYSAKETEKALRNRT